MKDKAVGEIILREVTDTFKSLANSKPVIGESFQSGEFTVTPILKVKVGFGGGSGEGEGSDGKSHIPDSANIPEDAQIPEHSGSGGGGGGEMNMEPIALLLTRGDECQLLHIGEVCLEIDERVEESDHVM